MSKNMNMNMNMNTDMNTSMNTNANTNANMSANTNANMNIEAVFDHLHDIICSERFLNMEGLGNEVPFFIRAYPPELQFKTDQCIKALVARLSAEGLTVVEVNLFDLCIALLRERGKFDTLLAKEASMPKERMLKGLQATLDIQDRLVPAIADRVRAAEARVVFITGIGLVFPFIRSHNILNNLQKVIKDRPTIFFFPGDYRHTRQKGSTLNLFGLMTDDKYYRAFDLDNASG